MADCYGRFIVELIGEGFGSPLFLLRQGMTFSGKPREQNLAELDLFIALLIERDVRSYLEIGCKFGDTLHRIGSSLSTGSRIVGIDLPNGDESEGGTKQFILSAITDLNRIGMNAHAILEDSHSFRTRDRVTSLGKWDAILIDGDHSSGGLLCDFILYGPLAPIVAFHDIQSQSAVSRLWKELKSSHETKEIGKSFGIILR